MIRAARQNDLDALCEILRDAVAGMRASGNNQWDSSYPDRAHLLVDIAEGSMVVCEQDGDIAGFIVVNTDFPPEYSAVTWQTAGAAMCIHRMAVAPRFHGRGLAAGMVTFCENIARAKGFSCIHTDTNGKNVPVNALFQKLGYRFCGNITLRANPDLFNCYEKAL